jgi:hypothetical protein
MLTDIEKRYVAQGYRLPPGLTWLDVRTDRDLLGLDETSSPTRRRTIRSGSGAACTGRSDDPR